MNTFLKYCFECNKKYKIAVISLITIIVLVNLFSFFLNSKENNEEFGANYSMQTLLDSLEADAHLKQQVVRKDSIRKLIKEHNIPLYFDPNKLNATEWIKMGASRKIANTICSYIKKGGHFYKKSDLKKINDLPKEFYNAVESFILIEDTIAKTQKFNYSQVNKAASLLSVDINTSNEDEWIALKYIGITIAKRIIKYKNALGGFYSINQIREVYGINDTIFASLEKHLILKNGSYLKMLNINTASIDELKKHPYIKYKLAQAIVSYREQHGEFKFLEDVTKIVTINNDLFEKIKPYLTIN